MLPSEGTRGLRWISVGFLAAVLPTLLAVDAAAQYPSTLPPNPSIPSSPPGLDELTARRRLLDAGFTDIQGMTPDGNGGYWGRATRPDRRGIGYGRQVGFEINARGHIRTW